MVVFRVRGNCSAFRDGRRNMVVIFVRDLASRLDEDAIGRRLLREVEGAVVETSPTSPFHDLVCPVSLSLSPSISFSLAKCVVDTDSCRREM